MEIMIKKEDTLIVYEHVLYNKLNSIRDQIVEMNQLISMPNSSFELRSECNSLREKYAALNQHLVIIETQLKPYKKEKSTSRQESTYKTNRNH